MGSGAKAKARSVRAFVCERAYERSLIANETESRSVASEKSIPVAIEMPPRISATERLNSRAGRVLFVRNCLRAMR